MSLNGNWNAKSHNFDNCVMQIRQHFEDEKFICQFDLNHHAMQQILLIEETKLT